MSQPIPIPNPTQESAVAQARRTVSIASTKIQPQKTQEAESTSSSSSGSSSDEDLEQTGNLVKSQESNPSRAKSPTKQQPYKKTVYKYRNQYAWIVQGLGIF